MTWQLHPCTQRAGHPGFAAHAAVWDDLQRRTTDTPFLEATFIGPALEEFGNGRELLALHHNAQSGAVDAAAIVQPLGRGRWESFQPSQLPLGPWLAAADDDLAGRMQSLLSALPGLALGLGVTQLDPRLQRRPTESATLRLLDYIDTPGLTIEGPFESYWEARGKNLRQNTRKQHKKLQTEGTEPRLECITDPADVAAALVDYGALESAGWKADNGTAIHPDNAQGRFYGRMLSAFCAQGRGRIVRYRFGDKVVSMDLCIDNGPLVVILKTTYDESYRSVSPSTLMRHDEFEAWWGEGRYQRIEFYGKTMEWHTRWTAEQRRLYHATVYRWGWLQGVHERLARRLKAGANAIELPA
ncbi:MAG: GNAT family N-acetyltransferase [Pseudomonadota bacterium]|nr:GNAT family N-acetyltransferase [Pseudomonadota bacterium]